MKFKLIVGFTFSFLLLLTSCNSQPVVLQTPILTQKPTLANSPIPTATLTFTPSSTFSPAQITATADRARDIEDMQFRFTAAPATLEARNVKCKDGFVLEQPLEILRASNDIWTLFTCSPISKNNDIVDYGTRYTQVTKNDLSQTWVIEHNTFDYSIIDRQGALMVPFRWTTDNKYLYLQPRYYPGSSGGPMSTLLRDYKSDLYRINLKTGEFKLVLQKEEFDALALSPNDQFLLYSQWDKPDSIHIRNMEDAKDTQVKLNEEIIASGAFIWNSENTLVVFITAYGKDGANFSGYDISSTSVFTLTLKNMHPQKILSKDTRIFIVSDDCSNDSYWLDQNTICLDSNNHELDRGNDYFTINIRTGMVLYLRPFLKATATFTPKP